MQTGIPRYALYGEEERWGQGSVAHCQPLFSDIKRQNWEIKPHRHSGLHQFIVIESGDINASIDGCEVQLSGPVIVSIPSEHVHGFGYSPTAKGRILTIDSGFLNSQIGSQYDLSRFVWLQDVRIIPFSDDEKSARLNLSLCLTIVEHELRERDHGSTEALGPAITVFLVAIGRLCTASMLNVDHASTGHYQKLARRFQDLAAEYYTSHIDVDEYSRRLGVTPRQLGRICQSIFGKPPMEYVHELLNREARRKLVYTNSSVSEVCYELGFIDPSYFSRFFRKRNGVSPRDFARERRRSGRVPGHGVAG